MALPSFSPHAYFFTSLFLPLLHWQIRPRIIEVALLSLGPLIQARSVHDDLAIGGDLDVRAVHRARGRTFEVHPFAVIAAAVTGALELVFACFPVRGAAQVRAARVYNKDAVRSAVHPDAV